MEYKTDGDRERKIRIDDYTYMLVETNFNAENREMVLVFLRGPYNWIDPEKNRGKKVYKRVMLTNNKLEHLKQDEDEVVAKFASEIVSGIKDENLYPSWYLMEKKEESLRNDIIVLKEKKKKDIKEIEKERKRLKSEKRQRKRKLRHSRAKCKKICRKLSAKQKKYNDNKISLKKKEYLLNKISKYYQRLAIYDKKFEEEYSLLNGDVGDTKEAVKIKKQIRKDTKVKIKVKLDELSKVDESDFRVLSNEKPTAKIQTIYKAHYKQSNTSEYFTDLHVSFYGVTLRDGDSYFKSLSTFNTKKYYNVTGCYIIRNRYNGKCYVGQSKNIGKRIEQHFDGTKPRNYIFADDYYRSFDKTNLFEIAIVKCLEYELNNVEKNLISRYKANIYGYNKTAGGS